MEGGSGEVTMPEGPKAKGCGLCGDPLAGEKVSEEELEVAHFSLSSLTDTTSNDLFTPFVTMEEEGEEEGEESPPVFCGECVGLIKETNRLHTLLNALGEELEENVRRMKAKAHDLQRVKGEEEEGRVKEEMESDEGMSDQDLEDFLILPHISTYVDERGGSERSSSSSASEEEEEEPRGRVKRGRGPSSGGLKGTKKKKKKKVVAPRRRPLATGKVTYKCGLCDDNATFPSRYSKLLHTEVVHCPGAGEEVKGHVLLYSRLCGKSSMIPRDLREHNEKYHERWLKFKCTSCTTIKKFSSGNLLEAHKVTHLEKGEEFKCLLCEETKFKEAVDLDNHILRVHCHGVGFDKGSKNGRRSRIEGICDNEKKKVALKFDPCRFCGLQVNNYGLWGLRAHERKEHGEEFKFNCGGCHGTFVREDEMRTCEESHKERGPYQCLLCNSRFGEGPLLREHLEGRHTEGGFKCEECSARLPFPHALKVHKARLHGGQMPYTCGVCGAGKNCATALKDHMRVAHGGGEGEEFIPCDLCDKRFAYRRALRRHVAREHQGISFTCEDCGKVYRSENYFRIHRKIHAEVKDQVCHVCGKAFANPEVLRIHLRVHTGEKPHLCHICGRAFSQRSPLVKHWEVHKKDGSWREKEVDMKSS